MDVSIAIGVFGEQEWKGETFDGLTRTTVVVGKDGRVVGILQGIKPDEHAAKALELLRS